MHIHKEKDPWGVIPKTNSLYIFFFLVKALLDRISDKKNVFQKNI